MNSIAIAADDPNRPWSRIQPATVFLLVFGVLLLVQLNSINEPPLTVGGLMTSTSGWPTVYEHRAGFPRPDKVTQRSAGALTMDVLAAVVVLLPALVICEFVARRVEGRRHFISYVFMYLVTACLVLANMTPTKAGFGPPIKFGWPATFLSKHFEFDRGPWHTVQAAGLLTNSLVALVCLAAPMFLVELATRQQFRAANYRAVIPFAWIVLSAFIMFVIGRFAFPGP